MDILIKAASMVKLNQERVDSIFLYMLNYICHDKQ